MIVSGDLGSHFFSGNLLVRNSEWSRRAMCAAWKVCPPPIAWLNQMAALMTVIAEGVEHAEHRDNDMAIYTVRGDGRSKNGQDYAFHQLPSDSQRHVAMLPQRAMN